MAVTAVVVARMTSTATSAWPVGNEFSPSVKQQIETVRPFTGVSRSGRDQTRCAGPEVGVCECVRVQAAPVDFHAEQFLQPDVTEVDVASKVIEQRKLAWLVWRLEDHGLETERLHESVCEPRVQASVLVEESDCAGAFPSFDHELDRAGVEPGLSLVDPCRQRLVAEPAVVLLAKFHLHVEA